LLAVFENGREAAVERAPEDEAGYAAAERLMPNSDALAELIRRGYGPPPGWFNDEDWSDLETPAPHRDGGASG
jgi:hypothetical protein